MACIEYLGLFFVTQSIHAYKTNFSTISDNDYEMHTTALAIKYWGITFIVETCIKISMWNHNKVPVQQIESCRVSVRIFLFYPYLVEVKWNKITIFTEYVY